MKSLTLFHASIIAVAFVLCCSSMTASAAQECVEWRNGKIVCKQVDYLCVKDRVQNTFCSTKGGGIVFDLYGVPVCGPGECIKTRSGDVVCSSETGGVAVTDIYGTPICSGSCIPANHDACVKPGSSP